MNKKNMMLLLVAAPVVTACCNQCLTMTVSERQLLDARHDHLRCEVYLDRLRDLYNVPDEQKDGLMDEDVDPEGIEETVGIGAFDGPLTGKHDGPLTGKHDGPLTRGHDDPLTGKHDDMDKLREATMISATKCWDATERLVEKYNECLETYVECRDDGVLTTCYEPDYRTCLDNKNTP